MPRTLKVFSPDAEPRTLKVFSPDADEAKERLVETVYNRERDLLDHENTLARYRGILSDPTFVGRTFPDGSTYRQKLEKEVLVLE